jgi:alkylation response protein AidB-like acyl-CoA dehydrogenase
MPVIDRRNLRFTLYELLGAHALTGRERYAEHSRETFDAALDLALEISEKYFVPHNREADLNEPHVVDGRVQTIPAVKIALGAFRDAGFFSAHASLEQGGMGLPNVVSQAAQAMFIGANPGTGAYAFLTIAAGNLLEAFGTDVQKTRHLGPMRSGRWFGTMALSEPQAGSSLADITTRAEQLDDGSYRVTGSKMWISAGEHELSENIVHLVLARLKDAPAGVKGISLFIVPRYRAANSSLEHPVFEHNDVNLGGLLHKMGYRGTTSTVLNFGERGDCHAELIGEPNKGLSMMFHMMNEARIGVGMGAAMLAYQGFLYSLKYARERGQGRLPSSKNPLEPPVKIIQHADVKRMLLAQKTIAEGSFALGLYCSKLVDDQLTADEPARREAGLLLDILTPIMKAWASHYGLEANAHAIQILGGYGYTREYPVEQFYRDNRLNPIHEGTNGIQGIDLLGRKVTQFEGASLKLLEREIEHAIEDAKSVAATLERANELEAALTVARETTAIMISQRAEVGADAFLANSWHYLELMGHLVIAWMWLQQATVAARALETNPAGADAAFYAGKLHTCQYFYRYELPKLAHWGQLLRALDTTTITMKDEWF